LLLVDFVTVLGTHRLRVPGHDNASVQATATGAATVASLCYKPRVRREFSAGGVLVRRLRGRWMLAAIRPAGKEPGLWALPKGLIGSGEKPDVAARREVAEET